MLLSELFKPEHSELKSAYGTILDKNLGDLDVSTPPDNLEFLGLVLELDEEGNIYDDLLDTVISYRLTQLPIALEVPSHLVSLDNDNEDPSKISLQQLILLSSNMDCALSFLPPKHPLVDASYTVEEYSSLMADVTSRLLKKANHVQTVMPVSNFQEYLMLEEILGADNEAVKTFKPQDEYILNHFHNILSVEEQNQFKDSIRQALYEYYGSAKEFSDMCKVIFKAISEKSKSIMTGHISSYYAEEKAKWEAEQANQPKDGCGCGENCQCGEDCSCNTTDNSNETKSCDGQCDEISDKK